ncbi:hypothetical protein F4803DRAFT_537569 [Xylaria telfairii]|nr:hypothetical protein F4803DRAFT_537569 [Xylaria telfairii]
MNLELFACRNALFIGMLLHVGILQWPVGLQWYCAATFKTTSHTCYQSIQKCFSSSHLAFRPYLLVGGKAARVRQHVATPRAFGAQDGTLWSDGYCLSRSFVPCVVSHLISLTADTLVRGGRERERERESVCVCVCASVRAFRNGTSIISCYSLKRES